MRVENYEPKKIINCDREVHALKDVEITVKNKIIAHVYIKHTNSSLYMQDKLTWDLF